MGNYDRNFAPDEILYAGAQGGSLNEVRGVQSVDVTWAIPENPLTVLGAAFAGAEVDGEVENSVTASRLIVTEEDHLTGILFSEIEGALVYGARRAKDLAVVFSSGFITSYNSSCSLGDVPSADVNFSVYGNLGNTGSTDAMSLINNESAAQIPVPGNIEVNVSGYQNNAVQSYELNIDIPRLTNYGMGGNFTPSSVTLQKPIIVSVGFDMIANDYEVPNIRSVLCAPPQQDLSIELKDCEGNKIRTFNIPSGRFTEFNQNSSVTDNMVISANYTAYYSSETDVNNIFS